VREISSNDYGWGRGGGENFNVLFVFEIKILPVSEKSPFCDIFGYLGPHFHFTLMFRLFVMLLLFCKSLVIMYETRKRCIGRFSTLSLGFLFYDNLGRKPKEISVFLIFTGWYLSRRDSNVSFASS